MTSINDIAEDYVARYVELDPQFATDLGVTGHDHELTDYSLDGFAERNTLTASTLAAIRALEPADENERVAKEAMEERLALAVETYEAGDDTSALNVLASPFQAVRSVFDQMSTEGEENHANIAKRLAAVPAALEQLKATLADSAAKGHTSARRQVLACAKQAKDWNGELGAGNFWTGLVQRTGAGGAVRGDLDRGAEAATAATADFGRFLTEQLLATAPEKDAVGRERYQRASREFLGDVIDLEETYQWGLDEVARLRAEMNETAERIVPGGSLKEALAALDADPARQIAGADNFRAWMQDKSDAAVEALADVHFDIPEPVRRLECMIAPTHDGVMYYTPPSEDFERPGRMWWSVPEGQTEFATWRETTTVYHEGVPGHHLQCAQTAYRKDVLNRWQRSMCWVSGHGEGWALYAERLMDDLGYLADPADKLGMLDGQMMRAVRVVVDLGMHLEFQIPAGTDFGNGVDHGGRRWTPELGWEYMTANVNTTEAQLAFELDRYLGWPGQAPAYKIGERIWLQARDDAKARNGADFDLKTFHRQALDLGSIGLKPLREALERL
ncbi:DUF885 domain-containing protein [Catenulispora pinisilvae]|uniref:DUF885 domain-containing protein n=1 Tax=Catenulispora pinisilvae TaxID=2705253 RepID=UPI0018920DAF|nr:DUF885 domain-containing protein [Catenulispora pinisilvae]